MFRVCFAMLCSSIGIKLTSKCPIGVQDRLFFFCVCFFFLEWCMHTHIHTHTHTHNLPVLFLIVLTLTMLWANSVDDKLICFLFSLENRIWHFMQIVSYETICMKCQILRRQFAWNVKSYFLEKKNKKNISKCLLKFLPSMQSVKNVCF